jgi:hypothetical protein
VHRDQRRHARPFLEDLAHAVAGRLGGDHAHVDVGRRLDLPKRMLKPWANISVSCRLEVGRDVLLVDLALDRVGQRHHDHVGFGAA